nr:hypothetical protein [Tanacetum cinerariifolium]
SVYGLDGGIFVVPNNHHNRGFWGSLLLSIHSLKQKGSDLISLCSRKIGNGAGTRFWDDILYGAHPLKVKPERWYGESKAQ